MFDSTAVLASDLLDLPTRIDRLISLDEDAELAPGERQGVIYEVEELSRLLRMVGMVKVLEVNRTTLEQLRFRLNNRLAAGSPSLGPHRLADLRAAMTSVREGFANDLDHTRLVPAYRVAPDYDFGLRSDVEPRLPDDATLLLDEARQCWALGRFLAALLITFIAAEQVTSYYYEKVVGHARPERHTWGMMLGDLKAAEYGCPDEVTETLCGIVNTRNQLVHGERLVDEVQAEVIYAECATACRDMVCHLVGSQKVYTQPDRGTEDQILLALEAISGRASIPTVARILCGEMNKEIEESGWQKLPAFGALRGISLQHAEFKLQRCIDRGILIQDGELRLRIDHQKYDWRARECAVNWIFYHANACLANDELDAIWPRIERVSPVAKKAFLREVSKHTIVELAPVLRSWFVSEKLKQVRRKINATLQALGEVAIPHSAVTTA